MNVAVIRKTQVSRPLKVLVPLIQEELIAGGEAGMGHYIKAGTMLNEVRRSHHWQRESETRNTRRNPTNGQRVKK
jgi:hypothetical protein